VVCTSRGSICFHIFFHDDPAAPEPFTDTDSLIYALRTPVRRGVIALLSSGFSLLLALDFCHLRLGLGPVYRSGLATPWLFLCVCCLLLFLSSGTDLIMLLTFRRRFSQGLRTPIPLSVSLHRFQLLLGCSSALLFLLAIFSLSVTLGFSHSDLPLTNWDPDFSLLTLAEVEGGDGWTPDENRTVSPHGWPDATPLPPSSAFHTVTCNDVDIDRSLVRTRYFIDQSGSGARGRASMEVHYFIDPTARSAQSLLEELEQAIRSALPRQTGEEAYGELLTNQRQAEAAGRALESVRRAGEALDLGVTPDALLTDVEEALSALGELTGQSVRDDVTDRIFQRFCVGK